MLSITNQKSMNSSAFHWLRGVGALAFALSAPAVAQDGSDHPLLSRVAGTTLTSKSIQQFDVVRVNPVGTLQGKSSAAYEGRVTKMSYGTIGGSPPGEVAIYRNYLAAVKQRGGRQLNEGFDANRPIVHVTGQHVFALSTDQRPPIAVLSITNAYNYGLTIIEPEVMAQSVKAGEMAEQIKKTGVASLHINFDTAKAELKDDGRAVVQEIATLLKGDPALKLVIEGHTDNVGSAPSNKELSHARAQAVVNAVVAQGIDVKRLNAAGYGEERPVADNGTETGRAKNRRVDLVKAK
jgi:OOP family OmpA-OmpF porin